MSVINPINKSFCLEKICETNYQKLFRLIPGLLSIENNAIGYSAGKPALYIDIVDKTAYTVTVQLSHCFEKELEKFSEPAIKIRLYQDAQLAEVIRDHNEADVSRMINKLEQIKEIMDYKWSLNYFLEKWLDHCLYTEYQFEITALPVAESV